MHEALRKEVETYEKRTPKSAAAHKRALERIPLGVAKVRREGTDLTAVTYGWQVQECLAAAEELQKEGVSLEVIDLRTLVPLDYDRVLDSVKKTRRALVVHAATEFCGFGAELASTIGEELFSTLKAPVSRLGVRRAVVVAAPAIAMKLRRENGCACAGILGGVSSTDPLKGHAIQRS